MSKIEKYKEAKFLAERASEFASCVNPNQPHNSGRYTDKLGIKIDIRETYAGSYGNSSVYSWSDFFVEELKKQINIELRGLIMRTADRLCADAEAARRDAREEAEAILVDTKEETK